MRLTGIAISTTAKEIPEFAWTEQPQTSVQLMRGQLNTLGWKVVGPWRWHRTELDRNINLAVEVDKKEGETEAQARIGASKAKKEATAHQVLESFRNLHWKTPG